MDGLTSQTAIEEFLKQGVHDRIVRRSSWPMGMVLVLDGEDVLGLDSLGNQFELSSEDLAGTDWAINEREFL